MSTDGWDEPRLSPPVETGIHVIDAEANKLCAKAIGKPLRRRGPAPKMRRRLARYDIKKVALLARTTRPWPTSCSGTPMMAPCCDDSTPRSRASRRLARTGLRCRWPLAYSALPASGRP